VIRRARPAIAVCALLSAATTALADIPADLDAYVGGAVRNGTYVGVIVGLIDGGETFTRAYGVASLDTNESLTPDTIFEIGSITKTMTAALLADASLSGEVALDDPVQQYLPDDVTIAVVGERPITLEDLATHRSGMPRMPADFAPANAAAPYDDYDQQKLWTSINRMQPARAPGVAAEYSNFGMALLGEILARASGESYRDLITAKILAPLGMTSSDTVLTPALRARAARGYRIDGMPSPYWALDAFAGAGAVYSSLTDMLAFLRAEMAASDDAEAPRLSRAMALTQRPRADFSADGNMRIGLGWLTLPGGGGRWHNGGTGGFRSFIGFTDGGARGIVVLTNSGGVGVDEIGFHALKPAIPLPAIRQKITLAPRLLDEYVGAYALGPEVPIEIMRRNDGLYFEPAGQSALEIDAWAPDKFFAASVQLNFEFERNDSGEIVALIVEQNGIRTRADRLGDDGEPVEPVAVERLAPEVLEAYLGRYTLAPGVIFALTRDGNRLMAQLSGQPRIEIFPDGPDRFVYHAVEASIDFTRDATGRVVSLTLHQNGADMPAPRSDD